MRSLIRIQATELKDRGVEPGPAVNERRASRGGGNWETSSRTSSTPSCATFCTNNSGLHNVGKSSRREIVPKLKLPNANS